MANEGPGFQPEAEPEGILWEEEKARNVLPMRCPLFLNQNIPINMELEKQQGPTSWHISVTRSLGWRRGAVGKGRPILTDRQLAHALRWRSAAAGRSAASASPKTVKNEASSIPPEIFSGIHMNSQEFPSCREGELD